MSKRPSFQFYPADWSANPNLKRCSFAEKGIWLEVMCLLHDQPEYGVLRWPLDEIATAVKCRVSDLKALQRKGVMKGDDQALSEPFAYVPRSGRKDGAPVTLVPAQAGPVWFSSRMVRDEYVREQRAEGGSSGKPKGAPKVSPDASPKGSLSVAFGPRDSSSSSSSTSSSVSNETGVVPPPDPNAEAWRRAKALLKAKGGISEAKGGNFFGKLLRDHRLEGRDLLASIVKAETLTDEPRAYLTKCAQWIAQRRGSDAPSTPEDRVSRWDADTWSSAVEGFRSNARWSDAMGPRPDQPGCQAPASVLEAHGYHRSAA